MAAIYCRDDVGGSGLRRIDAVRIFEKLADRRSDRRRRSCRFTTCAHGWSTASAPRNSVRTGCPGSASMDAIASYCLTEPGAGSDAACVTYQGCSMPGTTGCSTESNSSSPVAGSSDVYVVMARTGSEGPKGISAFVVPKDTPGLSFGTDEQKMGWNAQPTAQVVFEGARVPADASARRRGRRGHRVRHCDEGPQRRPHQHRRLLARRRAGRPTTRRPRTWPTGRPSAAHCSTSRPSGSRWPTWRPRCETSRTLLWRAATALDEDHPDRGRAVRDGQAAT